MAKMEKANWKDDVFLRTLLADKSKEPTIKGTRFDKQITYVIKPKRGLVYRKTCPEWARNVVEGMLNNDKNVSRFFILEVRK